MSLIVMIFLVLSIMGMSLYTTDALHKMKDDVRTVKIRTGKLIQLLDAVLSKDCVGVNPATAGSVGNATVATDTMKTERMAQEPSDKKEENDTTEDENEDSYISSILARIYPKQ